MPVLLAYSVLKGAAVLQVDKAYKLLEAFSQGEVEGRACVTKQTAEGVAWRESQELFELPVSEYTQLQKCQVVSSSSKLQDYIPKKQKSLLEAPHHSMTRPGR